jgi:SAM-dependent methyltransferase
MPMREDDIRPSDIFEEYLRLSARDVESIFDQSKARPRACSACGSKSGALAFTKNGFAFHECAACATLYANPLPPSDQFERFYRDSKSAQYWADVFVPRVMEARRAAIVRPRVARIHELCEGHGVSPNAVVDIGAGHGMFLEEWRHRWPDVKAHAVEPNGQMAEMCRKLGFEVYEGIGEEACSVWRGVADLVTCFEVVEHVPNLNAFAKSTFELLRPGGLAIVTSLGCDGFDIRVLWDRANCICPPSHINFCSRQGFSTLFRNAGFADVAIITPGELDVELVKKKLPVVDVPLSRFERTLLNSSEEVLADFQRFLARNGLSSHTWVLAHKGV